jgi:hypothetical protein
LAVITGTAAASPSPPTLPNNSVALAHVNVAAAATSILNANIEDQRVIAHTSMYSGALVTTSTTNPTNPWQGMMVYETDTEYVKLYNGTSWDVVWPDSSFQSVIKTANETVTSSTTLQYDNELAVTVAANSTYLGEIHAAFSGDPSFDAKCDWYGLTGHTMYRHIIGPYIAVVHVFNADSIRIQSGQTASDAVTIGLEGTGNIAHYQENFVLTTGTSGGTLRFRWAQNASGAVATTCHANSYMTLRKVA